MSIAASLWVWEHSEARGLDRLVLLAIADEADDLGLDARPSLRRLAHRARCGSSTARRHVERLEGAGELLVRRPDRTGRGHYNRYVVVMGRERERLAVELRWPPPPALALEVRQEWEQLALDTLAMTERHRQEGYNPTARTLPVAPYPIEQSPDDEENPGDGGGDTEKSATTSSTGPSTGPNRAAQGGTDPPTLDTSVPSPDASREPEPPVGNYLTPDEVHERLQRLKGVIPTDVEAAKPWVDTGTIGEHVDEPPALPAPATPEVCPACDHPWHHGATCRALELEGRASCLCVWPTPLEEVKAVTEPAPEPAPATPDKPDRWAERADLT